MSTSAKLEYLVLAILDGWGIAKKGPGNAIELAKKPNMDKLMAMYPHTLLKASGRAVGLPDGEEGNTETGHLNLGAGTVVYQDLERVNRAIKDGEFFKNKVLLSSMDYVIKNNSSLHLMGLISQGSVHSDREHLFSLIKLASDKNIPRLYIHLFTDGRDSPPTSALTQIDEVESKIKDRVNFKIASIMGRYYAMDRDNRWERTLRAYHALTLGEGRCALSSRDAIKSSYKEGKTDEFIEPTFICDKEKKPLCLVKDGDAIIFFNFRIDRPRQLSKAFVFKDFSKAIRSLDEDSHSYHKGLGEKNILSSLGSYKRNIFINNLYFATMTKYSESLNREGAISAFPPEVVGMPIGRVISTQGLRQLRITESEQERFVSVYFEGLREQLFPDEEKIIIPSPNVPTYDLKPEMSSKEITEELMSNLLSSAYKFSVVNYPNADMVGHTGNILPTIKAIETVDYYVGQLANLVLSTNGCLIITADHGNAEEMLDENNQMDTKHSINPVPFIVVSQKYTGIYQMLPEGILADVAPTILALLNISTPINMTGRNLMQGLL